MDENISIVGGAGFLGTKLSSILSKANVKHKTFDINFDESSSNFVDVENINSLEKLKNSSVIINLAAIHRDDIKPISRYDDVNIGGAKNICSCASKYDINTIIFTSSVAIYGFAPKNTGEDGNPNYFNDYGRTKYQAELIYKKWQSENPKDRTLVIIRPTVIFGEGNRGNVYNLLNQIYRKRFVMIGKGDNVKSIAYVDNVASFIKYSLNKNSGTHVYNYIDKPDLDMNSLVKLIRKNLFQKDNVGLRLPRFLGLIVGYFADLISFISGISLPISSIRVKKFLSNSMFSSKISETNFEPPFNLTDGLINTIKYEFVEDNKNKKKFYSE